MTSKTEKEKIMEEFCEKYALDTIMAESSDKDEDNDLRESLRMNLLFLLRNQRGVYLDLPKSIRWQQKVLANFDNKRFCQMLRVRPDEFNFILHLIKDDNVFKPNNNNQLPIDLQLKIVLFRLGSCGDGLSVRKVASLFGVGDGGTIQKVTCRVFQAIFSLNKTKFKCESLNYIA